MDSQDKKKEENLLSVSMPIKCEIKQEIKEEIGDLEEWTPQEMGNVMDIFTSEGKIKTPTFGGLEFIRSYYQTDE